MHHGVTKVLETSIITSASYVTCWFPSSAPPWRSHIQIPLHQANVPLRIATAQRSYVQPDCVLPALTVNTPNVVTRSRVRISF